MLNRPFLRVNMNRGSVYACELVHIHTIQTDAHRHRQTPRSRAGKLSWMTGIPLKQRGRAEERI